MHSTKDYRHLQLKLVVLSRIHTALTGLDWTGQSLVSLV